MLFAFAASLREEFSELCEGTVDRPGETHQATTSAMVLIVCTSYHRIYICMYLNVFDKFDNTTVNQFLFSNKI